MNRPSKRNKLKTKEDLTNAVSEMIRKGFISFNASAITNSIDRDHKVLPHHFKSLNNLIKTFISDRDYWYKLFEKYALPPHPGSEDLKNMFINIMDENFDIFSSDAEMQNIIRWQISDRNPTLKEVSDTREKEAEGIFKLTDPFFNREDVDIRAIMALLIGGVYYIVLHSVTNQSTVCGIDINESKDRDAVTRSIRQVISWAWNGRQP